MPATFETREPISADLDDTDIQQLIDLRIKATAIRCRVVKSGNKRFLVTEWNVIGEND